MRPTALTGVGIAKEATRGTAVLPTDFIPLTKFDPVDDVKYLEDKGLRGSMVELYGEVAGPTWSTHDMSGDVFPDTIGYALSGITGDVSTTGAGPFTHVMAALNSTDGQPKSFTVTDSDGIQARAFAAVQFSELQFTFNADGLLVWTGKAMGNGSATAANPVLAYSALPPVPGWNTALTIAATATPTVTQGTITLKRNVSPIHTGDGTQNPYRIWAGPLSVEGSLTLVMEDEANLAQFLTNAQPATVFTWTQGTASLALQMTKCAFVTGKRNRGQDYVALDVTFKAVANTTDKNTAGYSPAKATLINSKVSGTYN